MKKKQTRRSSYREAKDNISSSDDERMKSMTRSSSRKQKISAEGNTRGEVSMIDSAYEADDSARSDSSPPKQQIMEEEYKVNEDVPAVSRTRKRKNTPQVKQISTSKKVKKQRANLNMSTSTPVSDGGKVRDGDDRHLVTPEVTPILAECHRNEKSDKSQDMSTPTLRKSLRKRSFSFHDPDLSAISTELSFDSHADSGIVISPPLKKTKTSKPTASSLSRQQKSSKFLDIVPKVNTKNIPSTSSAQKCGIKKSSLAPQNYSVKGRSVLKDSSLNSSCFGFDSIQTPSPVSRPHRTKKISKPKKLIENPKAAYRSPKSSSDSMFDGSPCMQDDSSAVHSEVQENIQDSPSPALFSDDMFSSEQPIVNKSSSKSYKGFKPKLKKTPPQISKLDAWANSFNTELESIEKFDLYIG